MGKQFLQTYRQSNFAIHNKTTAWVVIGKLHLYLRPPT